MHSLRSWVWAFFVAGFFFSLVVKASPDSFRFHLKHMPTTIDPTLSLPGESTYLLSNLYRGLMAYTNGRLTPDLAQRCYYKSPLIVRCKIKSQAKFSDGSPILASHFVDVFNHIILPETSLAPQASLFFGIKNARDIYKGLGKDLKLGVRALSKNEIEFLLEKPDQDFLEKLTNNLASAVKVQSLGFEKNKVITSGPYKIKEWNPQKTIVLEPNLFYYRQNPKRPPVQIYFAEDDSTGVLLYEKGVTNFLWRLTATDISTYQSRPDYFQVPMSRFDYIGFNLKPGSVFEKKERRVAFAQALKFEDHKMLFHSRGLAGCPGLGDELLQPQGHCQSFNSKGQKLESLRPIKFLYSSLGGDDIKRAVQWFQESWHKNLGVSVESRGLPQKEYIDALKNQPPDAYRLGVALNRPTCLGALEIFKTGDSQNYIGFSNARYDQILEKLGTLPMNHQEKEKLCGQAVDILFKEEYVGVPLGLIHFTMLLKPEIKGLKINTLNQLDLADLRIEEK